MRLTTLQNLHPVAGQRYTACRQDKTGIRETLVDVTWVEHRADGTVYYGYRPVQGVPGSYLWGSFGAAYYNATPKRFPMLLVREEGATPTARDTFWQPRPGDRRFDNLR